MAETIDLLEGLRGIEGLTIEGELTVTMDTPELAHTVAMSVARRVREGLEAGTTPGGAALPGITERTRKTRKSKFGTEGGTYGHVTGELAESYRAVRNDDGTSTVRSVGPHARYAPYVMDGVDVETGTLEHPDVQAAFERGLKRMIGDDVD